MENSSRTQNFQSHEEQIKENLKIKHCSEENFELKKVNITQTK